MNGLTSSLQHSVRFLVLLAVGYQMTAIPVFPEGRESSTGNPLATCAVRSSCSAPAADCAPAACTPVKSAREQGNPGCADDPFRCETCAGCPVWCAVPFLNHLKASSNIPVLSLAARLQEEPSVWESLVLDLLTPPPKHA